MRSYFVVRRLLPLYIVAALGLVGAAGLTGCAEEEGTATLERGLYLDAVDGPFADHEGPWHGVSLEGEALAAAWVGDRVRLETPHGKFRQVGLMLTAASVEDLQARVGERGAEGIQWSEWEPVDVFFRDGLLANGLVLAPAGAQVMELRGARGLEYLFADFVDQVTARDELIRRDLNQREAGDVAQVRQGVAPSDLVVSRHEWQAIDPDKICGSFVQPYRATVHHTAGPNNDSDPYARMRSIQSFHINTREWCDIGYHFVVGPRGTIFQGRSRSGHPGAHVGNHNNGNVGISMMGTYVDVDPPADQVEGVVEMLRWVRDTHDVTMDRQHVRGHQEWDGAATACPGARTVARLDSMVEAAGGEAPEPALFDVEVSVTSDLGDFYDQGGSAGVADALLGESFAAEVRVQNRSEEPLRGVRLGLEFGAGGVQPLNYRIETDAPGMNQSSWQLNDADSAPENPSREGLENGSELILYAFAAGETKRVMIDLEATEYLRAPGGESGVFAFVVNIDDRYAQSAFGEDPTMNLGPRQLEGAEPVDVLSPAEWQFKARTAEEFEGWQPGGSLLNLQANLLESLIGFELDGTGWLESPDWTFVDADTYPEMVIRARVEQGTGEAALYFRTASESFSAGRALGFAIPADGEWHRLVVPMGSDARWSGDVQGLRLVFPRAEGQNGELMLDYLYFQDQAAGVTTSPSFGVAEQAPVYVSQTPGVAGPTMLRRFDPAEAPPLTKSNLGCSATGTTPPGGMLWLVVAAMLWGARRTNRALHSKS